jgi:hypothetical protein
MRARKTEREGIKEIRKGTRNTSNSSPPTNQPPATPTVRTKKSYLPRWVCIWRVRSSIVVTAHPSSSTRAIADTDFSDDDTSRGVLSYIIFLMCTVSGKGKNYMWTFLRGDGGFRCSYAEWVETRVGLPL